MPYSFYTPSGKNNFSGKISMVNLAYSVQFTKVFLPTISDDHMKHWTEEMNPFV